MGDQITMTKEQWTEKGDSLFGKDKMKWRFVCPGCGNSQSVEDFRQYKDKGATPSSAYNECIGRYSDGVSWTNDNPKKTGNRCDYAGYGLFRISPVTVIDDGKETMCFAFAEPNPQPIKEE